MTDTALSEEAMLASLRGLSLPAEAAGGTVADIAVAIGLAALMALVVVGFLRLITVKREDVKDAQTHLSALSDLPEDSQRIALLHMLKTAAPDRFAKMAADMYRPQHKVDLETLRAEVARHV